MKLFEMQAADEVIRKHYHQCETCKSQRGNPGCSEIQRLRRDQRKLMRDIWQVTDSPGKKHKK